MKSIATIALAFGSAVLAQKGASADCSPLHLVYARATGEPAETARGWSKGFGAAGFSLSTNVSALVPGADGYPVHYPAGMGTQCTGAVDTMKHLRAQAKKCPEQKFALGGHSQGGFVATISIKNLEKEILDKIVAVTMFGSPPCPANVKGKCISYCNSGDPVCSGSGVSGGSMETCAAGVLPKAGSKRDVVIEQRDLVKSSQRANILSSIVARNIEAAPDCQKYASMNTKGLGKGGHLGYNSDGTYVRAAACYIASKFKGSA